jgi:hypothetical protein
MNKSIVEMNWNRVDVKMYEISEYQYQSTNSKCKPEIINSLGK